MLDIILLVLGGSKLSGCFKSAGKTGAGRYIGGMIGCYVGGVILMYILLGIGAALEDTIGVILMLMGFLMYVVGIVGAIVVYQKGKKAAGPPIVTFYTATPQPYTSTPAPIPASLPAAQPESAAKLHYGKSCGQCGATSNQLAATHNWQWDGLGYCPPCDQYFCVDCQQPKGFGRCPVCTGQLVEKQ